MRALRKAKNQTQEELAEAIGRSVDTISNIERGASATKLTTSAKLAQALSVPLQDLYELEEASVSSAASRDRQKLLTDLSRTVAPLPDTEVRSVIEMVEVWIRHHGGGRAKPRRK